jgi:hypothetical protein
MATFYGNKRATYATPFSKLQLHRVLLKAMLTTTLITQEITGHKHSYERRKTMEILIIFNRRKAGS